MNPDSFDEWYAALSNGTRRHLYEHYWIKNMLRDAWGVATEAGAINLDAPQ